MKQLLFITLTRKNGTGTRISFSIDPIDPPYPTKVTRLQLAMKTDTRHQVTLTTYLRQQSSSKTDSRH